MEVSTESAGQPGCDAAPLDSAVAELRAAKDSWAGLPIGRKIAYLDRIRPLVAKTAGEWVAAAAQAKGLATGSALLGEEWTSGPYAVLSWIAAMSQTLRALADGRDPLAGCRLSRRADGQTVVRVYPHDLAERLLLHGYQADVWMQPGLSPDDVRRRVAPLYHAPTPAGRVALVLGAGNISSIAPLDMLYRLYAEGQVVLVKMNPINDYLRPLFERAFRPLVDDGYVRFVGGGADVGSYLCRHAGLDSVHVTGSASTHDAIVYGPGAAGAARRADDRPLLSKAITSELGGVGPTIVVPGSWTAADLRFQAEHVVTQKLHNSGHNCIAAQVLVLPENWSGSDLLLAEVRRLLARIEARPAYYAGAEQRRHDVLDHYPAAEVIRGQGRSAALTEGGVLIEGVDSSDRDGFAFTQEFFGPMLATTTVTGADPATFLRAAVRFANETLRGSLGANIIVSPDAAARLGPALDEAIADLRYGTVAVNTWTGLGYLLPRATWGAYPGNRSADIGSGIGVVHNALLLDGAEKTVVRGPFLPFPRSIRRRSFVLAPRPPWFVTNRTAAATGRRLTAYAADGRPWHLPGIVASALRG